MKNAKVVIGANFGDEGKGLMVDYFADRSDHRVLVVRFNGGSQAGHTVLTPGGKRHVFKHFGAGTFAGADTFLSQHFILNPIVYDEERAMLQRFSLMAPLRVKVDPRAEITTIFDMLLNRDIERHRRSSNSEHGSCGLGINETVVRGLKGLRITTKDLLVDRKYITHTLKAIRTEWLPARAAYLGINLSEETLELANDPTWAQAWIDSAQETVKTWDIITPLELDYSYEVIFEGAQGLGLDQNHGTFPYVTRSNTGLTNALNVAHQMGIKDVEAVYVTRAYLTRHGAGPMDGLEGQLTTFDPTNKPNEFQGVLRASTLNIDATSARITGDLARGLKQAKSLKINISATIAVTCLDHAKLNYADTGMSEAEKDDLVENEARYMAVSCAMPLMYISKGPTREHVSQIATLEAPSPSDDIAMLRAEVAEFGQSMSGLAASVKDFKL